MYKTLLKYISTVLFFVSFGLAQENGENRIYLISLFGILIVMLSLVGIYFFMRFIAWMIKYSKYKRLKQIKEKKNKLRIIELKNNRPDIETVLAISSAIHMELKYKMEEEKAILTINKLIRPYSPWSSKILSMRRVPDRR
ncbi:MAG: OadG family protein [Candidatus Marinimicrobia bacterium]|nr:OadG family protein [Candidatus Neomarinimicrobiota bacterium]